MARIDYLIFIHGVNVRERRESPTYANGLFELIKANVLRTNASANLVKIAVYWGDVGEADENAMLNEVRKSSIYANFHLKNTREKQIQQFVGDAALYTSRACGAKVVERINNDIRQGFADLNPADDNHVHLITHSWGTVILFDILFASRWDSPNSPAHDDVQNLRDIWFGIEPHKGRGLYIRSIHTMGSPLAMFSLMELTPVAQKASQAVIPAAKLNLMAGQSEQADLDSTSLSTTVPIGTLEQTHAITKRLKDLLEGLYSKLNKPLMWQNHCHPGDLVAYPLTVLLPDLLTETDGKIDVQDHLVTDAGPQRFENLDYVALFRSPAAHASYWHSRQVAAAIAQAISHS